MGLRYPVNCGVWRPLDCSEALSSRWRCGTSGFPLLVSGVELLGFCQIFKTFSRQKTTISSSRREILSFKSAYLSTYPPLTRTPSPWWGVWKLELGTRSKAQHWQHGGVSFWPFLRQFSSSKKWHLFNSDLMCLELVLLCDYCDLPRENLVLSSLWVETLQNPIFSRKYLHM